MDQIPQIIIDYFTLECVTDKSQLFLELGLDLDPTLRYHKKTFILNNSAHITYMYSIDSQNYRDKEGAT